MSEPRESAEPPVDIAAELAAIAGEPRATFADVNTSSWPLGFAVALVAIARSAASFSAADAALGRALYEALDDQYRSTVERIASRLHGVRIDEPAAEIMATAAPMRPEPGPRFFQSAALVFPLQQYSLLGRLSQTPAARRRALEAALVRVRNTRAELARAAAEIQRKTPSAEAAPGDDLMAFVAQLALALLEPDAVFDLGSVAATFTRSLRAAPTALTWTAYAHAYPDIAAELGWRFVAYMQTSTERSILEAIGTRRTARRLLDAQPAGSPAAETLRQSLAAADEALRLAAQGDTELLPLIDRGVLTVDAWRRVQFNRRVQAFRAATAALVANRRVAKQLLAGTAAGDYQSIVELYGRPQSGTEGAYVGSYYSTTYDDHTTQDRQSNPALQSTPQMTNYPDVSGTTLFGGATALRMRKITAAAAGEHDAERAYVRKTNLPWAIEQSVGTAAILFEYDFEQPAPGVARPLLGLATMPPMRVVSARQRIGVCVFRGAEAFADCGRGVEPEYIAQTLVATDSVILGRMLDSVQATAGQYGAWLGNTFQLRAVPRDADGLPSPTAAATKQYIGALRRGLVTDIEPYATRMPVWRSGVADPATPAAVVDLSWHLFRYLATSVAYTLAVMGKWHVTYLRRTAPLPLAHVIKFRGADWFDLRTMTGALEAAIDPPDETRAQILTLLATARLRLDAAQRDLGVPRAVGATDDIGPLTSLDRGESLA